MNLTKKCPKCSKLMWQVPNRHGYYFCIHCKFDETKVDSLNPFGDLFGGSESNPFGGK